MLLCIIKGCLHPVVMESSRCYEHTIKGTKMNQCKSRDCDTNALLGTEYCSKHHNSAQLVHAMPQSNALATQIGGGHYKKKAIQPWHIIDEYNLDFYLGNVVKYVLRDKGSQVEDLKKAIHYLERKVELLQENPKQGMLQLEID